VWALAGEHAPHAADSAAAPLVIDLDATLVTAHSDKESAAPTFKRGYRFHPLWSFATTAPAAESRWGCAGGQRRVQHRRRPHRRRPRGAAPATGPRTARPARPRGPGPRDAAGATHGFLAWLAAQRLSYPVGFTLPTDAAPLLAKIPGRVWAPAYDGAGNVRDEAWVARRRRRLVSLRCRRTDSCGCRRRRRR
jgi:hypothetical protein